MKKIKLFIIGMTSIMLLKPEVSIAQTFNQPGFLVYSSDISTPNLLLFDLNGSINNFPAPTGHVEVYNDRICISHYAGSYIDNIKIYDFQANLLNTIIIPVQLTTCLNFVVLPNLNFALLDNVNDKIYFLDNNGSLQKTINILDSPSPKYQNLDGVVVGNSLIFSENEKKQLLKIDLANYNVSVFKDFSHFAGSLGAIDYNNGRFYICTADAEGRKIYSFIDGQPEKLVFTLPGGISYISSIVVFDNLIYATFNNEFQILKIDISTGDHTVFYIAPAGTFYPYDIEGINLTSSPAPTAASVAATDVTITNAALNGIVNANDISTTVTFEYWTENSEISSSPATPSPVTGANNTAVSADITGLDAGTTYYFRVKAENTEGASFSDVLTFTTYKSDAIKDFDENYYNIVTIGSQSWMAENLKVTHFRDGTNIPNVTDPTAWGSLTSPGYCWYNNDFSTNKNIYGALYNFYTANTDNLCPTGWHVPTDSEWSVLTDYLGGESVAGDKLRETGTIHWPPSNTGATNESGFTGLPGGNRSFDGAFNDIGATGAWWSPASGVGWYRYLGAGISFVGRVSIPPNTGLSVRCLQSTQPAVSTTSITALTPTTAQSGGNVTSDGGDPITAKGVCWSTSQNPTILDNHTTDGAGTGPFTSSLTGLTPNTTYYFRAYATNSVGTGYDLNEHSFTTNPIVLATLTTTVPSSITSTTAVSGGNITSDGGNAVTSRGVCWSITGNPTISDNHTIDGPGIGSFTSSLSGLANSTTYYVRAYATNSAGTSYGNEVSFTTCAVAPTIGMITQPTCAEATGSVVLSSLPSSGTWTLTRNPGGVITTGSGTSTTVPDIPAGNYNFTVTNASGCTSVASGNVVINAQPITPTAPLVGTITQPTCAVATGSVAFSGLPAGNWTLTESLGSRILNGSGTESGFAGLTAGTYTFTVTNAYGCISPPSANVTINAQPVTPTAPIVGAITQPTCTVATGRVGLNDLPPVGLWTITRTPGNVTTSGSGTSYEITGLPPDGNYTFFVTNASGCTSLASANVAISAQPATLTIASPTITNVSCSSCNDAAINLTISGGTAPYSFAWTGPDGYSNTTQNIASLKPGSYSVVLTDYNGCLTRAYANVINPFVVTNTGDADEIGTLRYAINYANTHNAPTSDLITFNIPLGLPSTIQPVNALPEINQSLVIDGFTQPGASLTGLILQIELVGTNAGAGSNGLTIKSSNCTVKGLIIDGFSGNGIQIASGTGNTISANSIFNNDALGIDLGTDGAVTTNDAGDTDTGPNNLQNFPVLGSLSFSPGNVTVTGTLNSLPSLTYKLEFFANKVPDNTGYGEGQTYLGSGSVTTNSAGNGTFTVTLPTLTKYGDVITATATDPSGNTSEFSQAIGGLQDQILSSTKIPFIYRVNGKGVKSIPSTAVVNEVKSAFGNWSGIATSSMSFTYDKATPPQYASASDNINLVTFTDDKFPFSPGILAVTAKTLKVGANDAVAQIMDADIVFNPYFVNNSKYDFGIADNQLYTGFFDIQSVTTHEIGHILGLLHSGVYNATMWFEVGPGTDDRSLEQDDKSWLSYRYPNSNYNQTYGSISGNIKYGYNNDPVAGAIVLAVNPATSLAVVHAYSDADGNYLIPGLPPGSYRVYIMPLDGDVYGRDLRPGNISAYIYSNTFYTDYPGEFYNNPDGAIDAGIVPTSVTVLAGQVTTGIDFLTNKDVSNPTVVSVVPANNATGVSVLPNILITFSEPVDMNSLTGNSCYLTFAGSSTKIGGKYQPNGFEDRSDVVLFTLPENALSYESEYTLHITTGVTDLKTNQLGAEFTSTFHTGAHDAVHPTIKSTIPENNATNVFLTQKIMVFFSEPMIKSTVESSFVLKTDNGSVIVDCSLSWDEYVTLTLTPKSPLIEGKTYTISWTNAATDLSGNGLTAGSISFTTIPVAAPSIVYMEPGSSLKTNVAVETAIVVDFSEPIDVATITTSTFKLLLGTSQVSGTFEFLNDNSRVVFRPAANLTFGQTYTINLTNGIQDVSRVKQSFAGSIKTFATSPKPSKPHIDYNDPASNTGLTIEIGGNGFDPNPSKDKVTFSTLTSSVDAYATTASLTSLTVKVPYGAVSGAIRVTANGVLDDQDASNPTTYIFIGSFTDPCNTATSNVGTGPKPRDGAVDFNGANAYITNSGENTVSVITNLNTDDPVNKPPYELFPRIQVGTTPMKIDINTTGTRAYVTNFDSHTVSVIDLTDINGKKNQVFETIKVGVNPYGVVANGDKVYVANYGSDNITVINVDPASGGFDHATSNINTGTHNRDVDISPDGGTLAVTGDNGLTLVKITKTALGFDYAVSNANPGSSTRDATITKDGGTAIVTTTEGGIFFVDIAPGDNYGAAYGNINPGSKAGDGKTTFDGAFYYVTNPDDNTVTVYRITYEGSGSGSGTVSSSARLTLKKYATIPVGNSPEGIAMDPVNDKVVVVNSGSNNVTPVFICCPAVKTPSAYIKDLIFTVENMIYSGDIPKLRGYALIFTLNSSLRNINAGRTKLAVADLKVFIALVNTYMKNKQINTDRGNALIKAANAIIAKLQGTKSDTAETSLTDVGQSNLPDLISESKIGAIYPNPFSESITIDYEIADMELNSGKVMIQIFDVTGRVVCNLVNKNMEPGRYSVTWNGRYENEGLVSKGIYYIRFAAGKTREVKRIMQVR